MPFSASSRKAAGISTFGISNFGMSNFGISNLGISNLGVSKTDAVATGFGLIFGVAAWVEVVSAMTVILGLEGGFWLTASRRPRHIGSRLFQDPPLSGAPNGRLGVCYKPYIGSILVHCNINIAMHKIVINCLRLVPGWRGLHN